MNHEVVRVNLGERSYDIAVTSGAIDGFGGFVKSRCRGNLVFLVADEHVRAHADRLATSLTAVGFRCVTTVLPSGEAQKSLAAASQLYDRLVEATADRKTLVVAVGGGVVGDLAGFVAATFNRGLGLLMVPTTLLAMVDSSVGGKVGINHPRGKNLIGAFHQPAGVWIDTAMLETLPDREYRSGLAEVVKYGVILDAEFFGYLETNASAILNREPAGIRHVVTRCCRLKADVVEKDEREEIGLRMVLNYGHTFAHAFETHFGYGVWLHGEAVSAGMVCASRLAERRGLIPAEVTQRQIDLLNQFQLPTEVPAGSIPELVAIMRSDKKSEAGKLRFILPRRIGDVALFDGIPDGEVEAVLRECMRK